MAATVAAVSAPGEHAGWVKKGRHRRYLTVRGSWVAWFKDASPADAPIADLSPSGAANGGSGGGDGAGGVGGSGSGGMAASGSGGLSVSGGAGAEAGGRCCRTVSLRNLKIEMNVQALCFRLTPMDSRARGAKAFTMSVGSKGELDAWIRALKLAKNSKSSLQSPAAQASSAAGTLVATAGGWMEKKGKTRYFVLNRAGVLLWFNKEQAADSDYVGVLPPAVSSNGHLDLARGGFTLSRGKGKNSLTVQNKSQNYTMSAFDAKDFEYWWGHINGVINPVRLAPQAAQPAAATPAAGAASAGPRRGGGARADGMDPIFEKVSVVRSRQLQQQQQQQQQQPSPKVAIYGDVSQLTRQGMAGEEEEQQQPPAAGAGAAGPAVEVYGSIANLGLDSDSDDEGGLRGTVGGDVVQYGAIPSDADLAEAEAQGLPPPDLRHRDSNAVVYGTFADLQEHDA